MFGVVAVQCSENGGRDGRAAWGTFSYIFYCINVEMSQILLNLCRIDGKALGAEENGDVINTSKLWMNTSSFVCIVEWMVVTEGADGYMVICCCCAFTLRGQRSANKNATLKDTRIECVPNSRPFDILTSWWLVYRQYYGLCGSLGYLLALLLVLLLLLHQNEGHRRIIL